MAGELTARTALRAHASRRNRHDILIDEFWIPLTNERADLVTVGAKRTAYEIKSSLDTLKRLPRQVDAYGRAFDSCVAVVAEKHLVAVTHQIPRWWGLFLIAGDGTTVTEQRPALTNPELDPETVVRLLWKAEAAALLKNLGRPPIPGTGRSQMWRDLLTLFDSAELSTQVTQVLRARLRESPTRPATPLPSV